MGKPKDKASKKSQQSSHGGGGGSKGGKGGKDAAKHDKANERQEKARLKKDRQRNSNHHYRSDEDDRQFELQIRQLGCRINFMAGDGNCLFRSLADQIEGKPQDHAELRAQVVNHLEHNRQVFEPYMEDDEPFDEYIKRMRCDAEWGGNQELVAASQLYKTNVVVHQFQAPRFFIPFEKARRTMHLSYHGEHHYNSVRAIGDEGGGPAMVIMLHNPGSGKDPGDAAAKGAGNKSSPWPQQEEVVAQSCPWATPASVVDALHATGGREDDAIELLVAAQNEPALGELGTDDVTSGREHADATTEASGPPAYHEAPPSGQAGGVSTGSGAGMQESNTQDIAHGANGGGPADASSNGKAGSSQRKDREGVCAIGAAPKYGVGGRKHGNTNGGPLPSSAGPANLAPKEKKGVKKITRGADCHCGSGLKYKKCCRKKDAAIARGQIAGPAEYSTVDCGDGAGDSNFSDDLGALVI